MYPDAHSNADSDPGTRKMRIRIRNPADYTQEFSILYCVMQKASFLFWVYIFDKIYPDTSILLNSTEFMYAEYLHRNTEYS